jgi:hypothetical protein
MINIFRSKEIIVAMQWNGTVTSALDIYEKLKLFGVVSKITDLRLEINSETGLPSVWVIDTGTILLPSQWVVIENVENIDHRFVNILSDLNMKKNYSLEFGDALEHDLNTYNIKIKSE